MDVSFFAAIISFIKVMNIPASIAALMLGGLLILSVIRILKDTSFKKYIDENFVKKSYAEENFIKKSEFNLKFNEIKIHMEYVANSIKRIETFIDKQN